MGKLKNRSPLSSSAGPPRGGTNEEKDDFVSVPSRTSALIEGLVVILEHHETTPGLICEIIRQIREFLDSSCDESVWVKRLKYLLTRPLAEYLRNDLPSAPDIGFEFSGMARRWYRNRVVCFNRKNTHLWYSWFQAKRCCLPSSEEFIKQTYDDHFEALTKEDPGDEFAIDAAFSDPTFFRLLEKLRTGLEEYVGVPCHKWSASVSACFETTRLMGGQHSYLKSISSSSEFLNIKQKSWDCVGTINYLKSMKYFERVIGLGSSVLEQREIYGREDWESLDGLSWSTTWWECPLSCEIRGVIEPLKIRVISKGEALPYFSQKFLQRGLHDQMRRMDCFRLIGAPFSPCMIPDLLEKVSEGDHWFSVDYSAATDGLSWKFSERIMRFLLARTDERVLARALRVLGPHMLYYPTPCGKDKYCRGMQRNGQLMGSILSFPILCLANLAVYLVVNSIRQRDWTDSERLRAVLVNGDDMLYAAPRELWPRHIKVSQDLGLKMSPGKAYCHDRYANVNSTSILCPVKAGATVSEVPYLNVGLYFQSPVQKKNSVDRDMELTDADSARKALGLPPLRRPEEGIVACIPRLLDGCYDHRRRISVLGKYLVKHKQVIREECIVRLIPGPHKRPVEIVRNLFVHATLGGMGVPSPMGWKFRITRADKRVARGCLSPLLRYSTRPLPGYEIKVEVVAHDVWSKFERIPETPLVRLNDLSIKKLTPVKMILGLFPYSDSCNDTLSERIPPSPPRPHKGWSSKGVDSFLESLSLAAT